MFHLCNQDVRPPARPSREFPYATCSEHLIDKTGMTPCHLLDVEAVPPRPAGVPAKHFSRHPSTLPSSASAKMLTSRSTIPGHFDTTTPYIVVTLDEACRRQQVGEGWFASLDDVPKTAVSMSVRQILKAREILVIVPDTRKAEAVAATFSGEVQPRVPASILRTHPDVTFYLDEPADHASTPGRGSSTHS